MRGSLTKRGKNSWRIVIDLPRGADGKRRQKSVTTKGTKREAELKSACLVAEIETGGFVDPSKLTVREFLKRWLDQVETSTSTKTHERYSEIVRLGLLPRLGDIKLAKLKPGQIQELYSDLLKSGRVHGNGGLSPLTVRHYHRVLAGALKMAVKWQLITSNPIAAVEPPRPARKEIVTLNEVQCATLLSEAEGSALYVPIILAVTTGLRRGEALALRWSDVDLDRGNLSVCQSIEKTRAHGLRFREPKTQKGRRNIAMPLLLVDALKRHRTAQAELGLKLGRSWDEGALVNSGIDGTPVNPNTLTSGFASFIRKLDIPRVTFHGLRHSHATMLLSQGVHPKVAQERLGHSTISVTLDLYSHVVPGMQEDAALRVDRVLKAALGNHIDAKV